MKALNIKGWSEVARSKGLTFILLAVIMVIMPIQNRYLPPLMILLFLSWINDNYLRIKEVFTGRTRGKILLVLFISLFIWQLAGMTYSENSVMAWRNVSGRLAFLLFPLVLFNSRDRIRSERKTLLRIFAGATAVYLLSCFVYAAYRSLSLENGLLTFNPHPYEAEWENYFFSDLFTYSIHPSYMSMYAIMAFLFTLEATSDLSLGRKARIGWLIVSVQLIVSLYFISSRAALLAMIITVPVYLIYLMVGRKRWGLILLVILSIALISMPFIFSNARYKSLIPAINGRNNTENSIKDDRYIIWNSAGNVLKHNYLFGVGVGDVRDELVKVYDSIGEERLSKNRTNAHNQFLEIFLESGIPGILIFMAILGIMTFFALSSKDVIYALFIFMILIFFMFESVLYRFAGISFFSLFAFLILPQEKKS